MALAIRRLDSAFSQQPTGKQSKRVKDGAYLDLIRSLPCIVTGKTPVEAAHISFAEPRYGKLGRGKASKESDCWTVPLCPEQHLRQSNMNERAYWQQVGIDPCIVAMSLYIAYPREERALLVIRNIERRVPRSPQGINLAPAAPPQRGNDGP